MFVVYEKIDHSEIRKQIKALNRSGVVQKKIVLLPKMSKNQLAHAFILAMQECYDAGTLDSVPDTVYDYYLKIVKPDKKKEPDEPKNTPSIENKTPETVPEGEDSTHNEKIDSSASQTPKIVNGEKTKSKLKSKNKPKPKKTKKSKPCKKTKPTKKAKKTKRGKPNIYSQTNLKTGSKKSGRKKKITKKDPEVAAKIIETKEVLREKGITRTRKTMRTTRARVYADIILDGKPRTKKELVAEMQARYGGSEKEAPYWVGGYCSLLIALGKMQKRVDGTFVYKK